MNKLNLFTLFFASLFMLTLVSCDKDDDKDLSKTELLTGGEWTGDQIWMLGNNMTETLKNYGVTASQIQLDFKKDGSYTIKSEGEVMQDGAWEFSTGEKEITTDKGTSDENKYEINKLTSSELHLEGLFPIGDGSEMSMEIRLKR
ncbi:hypothetical protein [Pontibacter flavimaris]|uniref:Lipocalin-like domain-containing protein n=1 Tax=Pontibacter flavimaris TaxID=1797110 RepID=A0A1Q5PHN3_9BACT|nr:hypothetical protein [Pontibacter flavimaris]OKL41721.1 hypothetical protein A3841_11900 [Pontibacter flavimaris]